jgi:hypothetical protein
MDMRTIARPARICLVAALCAGAAGCSGREGGLLIAGIDAKLPDNEDSAAFLDRISSQERVSENDAMRGILFLTDGNDSTTTFEQRVKMLAERKVVDASWEFGSHRPITKGRLAYMVYQACKVRGGVILTLIGPSQRYCLRELEYQKLMSEGTIYTDVTGMEYVAVLTRADSYLHDKKIPQVMAAGEGQ